MSQESIWNSLQFSESKEESAYVLLLTQSELLIEATKGELRMEVEAVDSYIESDPPILVAIYTLYVVAPKLGNFRRKILSVVEGRCEGRFPVDIYCSIDDFKKESVEKADFLDTISRIMARRLVKNSIENLYQQSKEISR